MKDSSTIIFFIVMVAAARIMFIGSPQTYFDIGIILCIAALFQMVYSLYKANWFDKNYAG